MITDELLTWLITDVVIPLIWMFVGGFISWIVLRKLDRRRMRSLDTFVERKQRQNSAADEFWSKWTN